MTLQPALFLIVLYFFINTCSVNAQGSLVFCDSVSARGQAIGPFESLIMEPEGQNVKLLYKPESGKTESGKIKITFEKLNKSAFQKTNEITLLSAPDKEFVVTEFRVNKSGDYRVRYYSENNSLLADEVLSVSDAVLEGESQHETGAVALAPDSLHTTQILFSDKLPGDDINVNTEFSFRGTRGILYLIIEPFEESSPERIVDIWKKEGKEYSRFINSSQFAFTPDRNHGYAAIAFPEAAAYKVSLYTTGNVLITTSFVEFK